MRLLGTPIEFEWDTGNQNKNVLKHGVSNEECEEVFYDDRKKLFRDPIHSDGEERYILIGKTKTSRILFIVFTLRKKNIRVISARDLNKKERKLYEETTETSEI